MDTLEQKAREVGNNKAMLKKRLVDARSCLTKAYRKEFTPYTFDFENKRLVSSSGNYALQWDIRNRPDEPISYENQQTSVGIVYVVRLWKHSSDY